MFFFSVVSFCRSRGYVKVGFSVYKSRCGTSEKLIKQEHLQKGLER